MQDDTNEETDTARRVRAVRAYRARQTSESTLRPVPQPEAATLVTLTFSLMPGEHVRVAAGDGFLRISHGTKCVDKVKALALDRAVEAGILTEAEADIKRMEHGMLAAAGHILALPCQSISGLNYECQHALDRVTSTVRARVGPGTS